MCFVVLVRSHPREVSRLSAWGSTSSPLTVLPGGLRFLPRPLPASPSPSLAHRRLQGLMPCTARESASGLPRSARFTNTSGEDASVEALNPKTAAFFLAFLPQFVVPAEGHVALQFIVLGTISVIPQHRRRRGGDLCRFGCARPAGGAARHHPAHAADVGRHPVRAGRDAGAGEAAGLGSADHPSTLRHAKAWPWHLRVSSGGSLAAGKLVDGRAEHDHDGSEKDLNRHFLNATFEISYEREPPGVVTSTWSPTDLPTSARASGEVMARRFALMSASSSPTIW